jgi:hypothetical protein
VQGPVSLGGKYKYMFPGGGAEFPGKGSQVKVGLGVVAVGVVGAMMGLV